MKPITLPKLTLPDPGSRIGPAADHPGEVGGDVHTGLIRDLEAEVVVPGCGMSMVKHSRRGRWHTSSSHDCHRTVPATRCTNGPSSRASDRREQHTDLDVAFEDLERLAGAGEGVRFRRLRYRRLDDERDVGFHLDRGRDHAARDGVIVEVLAVGDGEAHDEIVHHQGSQQVTIEGDVERHLAGRSVEYPEVDLLAERRVLMIPNRSMISLSGSDSSGNVTSWARASSASASTSS
jgi:hypothetical protein